MSIIVGQAVSLSITLKVGGQVVSLPPAAMVTAMLVLNGQALTPEVTLSHEAIGANWPAGQVVIEFNAEHTAQLLPGYVHLQITAAIGNDDQTWTLPVKVAQPAEERSKLFSRDGDIASLRAGRLAAMCGSLKVGKVSDDYLWEAMQDSEAAMERDLGIFLSPTEVFPVRGPTEAELAELQGRPFVVEAGYDTPPGFFSVQHWGSVQLRRSPVIKVISAKIVYPSQASPVFTIPNQWLLLDRNVLQVVPGPTGNDAVPLGVFAAQAMSGGYSVPQMLQVRYQAGLTPEHPLYRNVRDLTLRGAVLRILKNSFIPQSSSISGDGLSQSRSMDVDKFEENLMAEVHALADRLKGPVWAVL